MLTYPKTLLDLILIVEANDTPTRSHLETTNLPNWVPILIGPPGKITTRPRAMNYVLPFCRGDIIGVYDAKDAPNLVQLSDVVELFARISEKTACIQAFLDLYDARSNALSRFFAIAICDVVSVEPTWYLTHRVCNSTWRHQRIFFAVTCLGN